MDAVLQSQLDRIETALGTLIESIAAYSPSIPAANNLLAADDQLQAGLIQLGKHQDNHNRIVSLHERILQQNGQISSTITALADARTDLLSTSTSLQNKETRSVTYTELLSYAKRISRYTVPPTFRPPLPLPNPIPDSNAAVNGDLESEKEGEEERKNRGTEALEDEERKWLEPLLQIQHVPWVSDDLMKRGALAQIQAMMERGEDPASKKTEGAKDVVGDIERTGEGVEKAENEDVRGAKIVGTKRDEQRQDRRVTKPAVFGGLDLYDPSNPDEDG